MMGNTKNYLNLDQNLLVVMLVSIAANSANIVDWMENIVETMDYIAESLENTIKRLILRF